jgi:hypothetical protein
MTDAVVATNPISQIESAISESTAEVVEALKTAEATEEEHWSKLADMVAEKVGDRVSEQVYDKVKKFVGDLLDATEDAAEIALESAAPATEAEAETAAPAGEEEDDVKPRKSHPLFRRPMKKED